MRRVSSRAYMLSSDKLFVAVPAEIQVTSEIIPCLQGLH